MDSISARIQRNEKPQLKGTLTSTFLNMSGVLSVEQYNLQGMITAVRTYPVVPTQEKTVVSSLQEQIVLPDANLKLSKVIVQPLPVSRVLNDKGGYTVTIGA